MIPKRIVHRRYILVVLLSVVLVFLRGCVLRPATSFSGSHFNRDTNAVWLGIEWVNESHSEAEISSLASDLQNHQILYAYIYVSYIRSNSEFGKTYSHAIEFIEAFKHEYPTIKLLAWYGIPTTSVSLADAVTRSKIVAFAVEMVELGFDGVQLDPELITDNDENLLTLLAQTRQAINNVGSGNPIVSLSTPVIFSFFSNGSGSVFQNSPIWSEKYYREVGTKTDQIALMTYDSGLTSPILYRLWTRFQVIQLTKALAGVPVQLFIGIPSSEEETATHHNSAENMTSGLEGLVDGLNDEESIPDMVTGAAIYPYWETSADEWKIYQSYWLGQ